MRMEEYDLGLTRQQIREFTNRYARLKSRYVNNEPMSLEEYKELLSLCELVGMTNVSEWELADTRVIRKALTYAIKKHEEKSGI